MQKEKTSKTDDSLIEIGLKEKVAQLSEIIALEEAKGTHEIETIIGKRRSPSGNVQYKVKYQGQSEGKWKAYEKMEGEEIIKILEYEKTLILKEKEVKEATEIKETRQKLIEPKKKKKIHLESKEVDQVVIDKESNEKSILIDEDRIISRRIYSLRGIEAQKIRETKNQQDNWQETLQRKDKDDLKGIEKLVKQFDQN